MESLLVRITKKKEDSSFPDMFVLEMNYQILVQSVEYYMQKTGVFLLEWPEDQADEVNLMHNFEDLQRACLKIQVVLDSLGQIPFDSS